MQFAANFLLEDMPVFSNFVFKILLKVIQPIYSRAAENVLISLDRRDREDAIKLISLAADNLEKGTLFKGISKLDIPGRDIFSVRLSELLRIIIEKVGAEIKVVDIVNYGLHANYA